MIAVEVVNIGNRVFCSMDDLLRALEVLKERTTSHDQSEGVHMAYETVQHVLSSFQVNYQ